MNRRALSIQNLGVEFETELGTVTALHNISLDLPESRTTAIVGESGSGKSVTAYAMLNMVNKPGKITGGKIILGPDSDAPLDILTLDEKDDRLYALRGGQISMIFQEPMTALSPVHTIGDQVSEAILIHRPVSKREAYEQARDMLGRVGIPEPDRRMSEYPFQYSGGMRQRVVIAMALVCEPRILICDEPTTALDVTVQAEILSLINELKNQLDITVMFITHDLGVVAQVADDVVVMCDGRVLETGSVRQILKAPLHPYTQALLAAVPDRSKPLQEFDKVSRAEWNKDQPLLRIKDGRQVALPISDIAPELRP